MELCPTVPHPVAGQGSATGTGNRKGGGVCSRVSCVALLWELACRWEHQKAVGGCGRQVTGGYGVKRVNEGPVQCQEEFVGVEGS